MHYNIFHLLFYIVAKFFFRYAIFGSSNVPKRGGAIIACNHASHFDPAIATTGLWRKVRFAARETLFEDKWAGWWLRGVQAFPISREVMDKATLKRILGFLEKGDLVLMFPEGTRSPGGELQEPKPGIGMVAYMSGVPVIPTYVGGTHRAFPRGSKLWEWKYVQLTVHYGKPVDLSKYFNMPKHKGMYMDMAKDIMTAIGELKEEDAAFRRRESERMRFSRWPFGRPL